jgi:glycogen phosphorylase
MNQSFPYLELGNVAYFSMDVAIDSHIPTYSGGLGILAGDMLHSAADLGVPMVGISLLHRKGYFQQRLDSQGNQTESHSEWSPENYLEPLPARVTVSIEGRPVHVSAWRYQFQGWSGHQVPVLFLDTNLPENDARDRVLTNHLYGGDERYRLCQELVLGFGGVAMLRALGYGSTRIFHLNEGHSAFVTLALLEQRLGMQPSQDGFVEAQADEVRQQCVFTTHTPVPAGHDRFSIPLVNEVLGDARTGLLSEMKLLQSELNMTELALRLAGFVNGVSMRHAEVSRAMFPSHNIEAVTNGVHAAWASPPFCALFDRAIPQWRRDNWYLRYAVGIPLSEIREAHAQAKRDLLQQVSWLTGIQLDEKIFTIGFARRATAYKRADLLFIDTERLKKIAAEAGPVQLVYAGKAHPRDEGGKAIIRRIFEAAAALANDVRVVYLENYDILLGRLICAGVDIWVNTPLRPQEASGTSGMKAALNGVPSLSVLDGWWIEGHVEGVTGWSIESGGGAENDSAAEAKSFYDKLQYVILPLFYKEPEKFAAVMRSAIALNGSFFNTQRMLYQYVRNAYAPICASSSPPLA